MPDAINDKLENDPLKIANLFNNHFTPNCDNNEDNNIHADVDQFTSESFKFEPITADYVFKELNCLDTKKAPGLDSLHPLLLKESAHFICDVIAHIFNTSLRTGCIPKDWKRARVTPLFKSGSKQEFSNYRPISVLPHIMKILEKAIHSQLYSFFYGQLFTQSLTVGIPSTSFNK